MNRDRPPLASTLRRTLSRTQAEVSRGLLVATDHALEGVVRLIESAIGASLRARARARKPRASQRDFL